MGGNIIIADKVVASIVHVAAAEIEGVHGLGEASLAGRLADALEDAEERTKGVRVKVGQDGVSVDLSLSVVYGYRIPEVADRVRQNVAQALRRRCNLATKVVDINVVGLKLKEGGGAAEQSQDGGEQ
ncbi:MAG: Asp23/Gls24 family envelope stress response protein [Chloroflexi bacterium]|nr:Asp23/Gls24 family envelope stress response protein [Chloroflexota bacterium]